MSTSPDVAAITKGYTFDTPAIELGVLVDGDPVPDAKVRISLSMLNRHGLVAGATGTGKTKTLQLMAEQIARAGVSVFAADIKGDLSGLALPGKSSEKLLARTSAIGQDWQPHGCPVEFYALGGQGTGVPLRATISSFGPILLSKVLGLNETQESTLGPGVPLLRHPGPAAARPGGSAFGAGLPDLGRGQGRSEEPGRGVIGDRRRHPAVAGHAADPGW